MGSQKTYVQKNVLRFTLGRRSAGYKLHLIHKYINSAVELSMLPTSSSVTVRGFHFGKNHYFFGLIESGGEIRLLTWCFSHFSKIAYVVETVMLL